MPNELSIPLGVVIAREKISNPWQDYRWRPVSVFFDAPKRPEWTEVRNGPGFVHFHAATLVLTLHRKECMAYRVNLANGEPSVYVVLREDDEETDGRPLDVHLLTASPFEAQSHGDMGFDFVEAVKMPDRLVSIIENFVRAHHTKEEFYKRKRDRASRPEDHKFGQEPIVVLRERLGPDGLERSHRPEASTAAKRGK
ncbi:MAG: DUF3305 domain-containing protein [Pseudomonadota bacterium]